MDSVVGTSGGLAQTLTNARSLSRLGYKVTFVLPPGEILLGNLFRVFRLGLVPLLNCRRSTQHDAPNAPTKLLRVLVFLENAFFPKYKPEKFSIELVTNQAFSRSASPRLHKVNSKLARPFRLATHYFSPPTKGPGVELSVHYQNWLSNFDGFLFENFQQMSEASDFAKKIGISKLFVSIRPSVDEKKLVRSRKGVRVLVDNEIKLVMVASLQKRKNQLLAIRAMPSLLARWPAVKLELVGDCDSEYFFECKRIVNELGLSEFVRFRGHRHDYVNFIRDAHLYLNISEDEGTSLALREAVFLGIPTVVSPLAGSLDLVGGKSGAWIVPQLNAENVVAAVSRALEDPEASVRKSEMALTNYIQYFSLERSSDSWREIIVSILSMNQITKR